MLYALHKVLNLKAFIYIIKKIAMGHVKVHIFLTVFSIKIKKKLAL